MLGVLLGVLCVLGILLMLMVGTQGPEAAQLSQRADRMPSIEAGQPPLGDPQCGNCGALCRRSAFDRAARIPDALIHCSLSESTPGVALAVLRSRTGEGPKLWVVGEAMMVNAEENVVNAEGRDIRLGIVQEAQMRWPWLFDSGLPGMARPASSSPQPAASPATAPVAAPTPALTASADPEPAVDSPWVLFATEEAMDTVFVGRQNLGDARVATQGEIDGVLGWIESLWPSPDPWQHMAWVDPQCPHCLRLHEEGRVQHYAPRVVLNRESKSPSYQQGLGFCGVADGESARHGSFSSPWNRRMKP